MSEEKTIEDQFIESVWPGVCLARAMQEYSDRPVTIMITAEGATLLHTGMYAAFDKDSEKIKQ